MGRVCWLKRRLWQDGYLWYTGLAGSLGSWRYWRVTNAKPSERGEAQWEAHLTQSTKSRHVPNAQSNKKFLVAKTVANTLDGTVRETVRERESDSAT